MITRPATETELQLLCPHANTAVACLFDGEGCARLECGGGQPLTVIEGAKPAAVCRQLGEAISGSGVTVKVKCGCSGDKKEQTHTPQRCNIHGRALPTLKLNAAQLEDWQKRLPESLMFHLCQGCEDFQPIAEKDFNQ